MLVCIVLFLLGGGWDSDTETGSRGEGEARCWDQAQTWHRSALWNETEPHQRLAWSSVLQCVSTSCLLNLSTLTEHHLNLHLSFLIYAVFLIHVLFESLNRARPDAATGVFFQCVIYMHKTIHCVYIICTKIISLDSYFLEANLWCSFTSIWAKLFLKTTFSLYISIFLLLVLWEPHKLSETWIVELPHLICEFSIFCMLLLGLVILFARCGSAAFLFLFNLYPLCPFPRSLSWLWVSMFPFYKWEFASSQSIN